MDKADKIEAYLGFCLKSRACELGADRIETLKGGVFLIIVCSSASENGFKSATRLARRFNVDLMVCRVDLSRALSKTNCKIIAIRDKNLARAIEDNACEQYEIYEWRQS